MSLDREQMAATAHDLRTNMDRAALTVNEMSSWLGIDVPTLEGVLEMRGEATPETVWAVRDAIEKTLREEGDAGDWSVLTEANRQRAEQWFSLREIPAR